MHKAHLAPSAIYYLPSLLARANHLFAAPKAFNIWMRIRRIKSAAPCERNKDIRDADSIVRGIYKAWNGEGM